MFTLFAIRLTKESLTKSWRNEFLIYIYIYIYKISNHDSNKFILLLWKVVYPYKYMDDCKKFNEISLRKREDFYSHLNKKDFTGRLRTRKNCL